MPASLEEIYDSLDGDTSKPPIVLIHDGGGTIFQYYMLGYLGRKTYAIANPYFQDGTRPDGGIPELAAEYVKAIREEIATGSIILGGWSFGGIISVEIARLLAESKSSVTVQGILMVDSYCPWAKSAWEGGKIEPTFRETTSERMKELTRASFAHAGAMIGSWEQPTGFTPPPAVMVKAQESRFKQDNSDTNEDDGKLGWSTYPVLSFKEIVEVPGNHFSMFSDDKLDNLTAKIKWACSQL